MARKFLTPLDMASNEIRNAKFQQLAADPGAPVDGLYWLNTTTGKLKIRVGGVTVTLATLDDVAGAGGGDMVKATYDTNDDGKVDAANLADAAPWAGVTGKPATFAPSAHGHTSADVSDFATAAVAALLAHLDAEDGGEATLNEFSEIIAQIAANRDAIVAQVKRLSADIGDGAATSFAVTHNFNTLGCIVQVFEAATGEEVLTDVTRNSVNQVTISFAAAPTVDQYTAVIIA